MTLPGGPTYDLRTVQELVGFGDYELQGPCKDGMCSLGLAVEDVEECICSMTLDDFHKSDPSNLRLGLMLDVYRPRFEGRQLYVKVQIVGIVHRRGNKVSYLRRVNVVSFKEK